MIYERLPYDIKAQIRKQRTICVLKWVLLELIVLTVVAFLGERLFSQLGRVGQILAYIILIALPFFITRFPLPFFDKSWCGEIIDSQIDTATAFTKEAKPRMYAEYVITLTIKKSDGNIAVEKINPAVSPIPRTVIAGRYYSKHTMKSDHFIDKYKDYKEGSRVYHFCGIKGFLVLAPDNDETVRCLYCGQENFQKDKCCWECGHTLYVPNEEDFKIISRIYTNKS